MKNKNITQWKPSKATMMILLLVCCAIFYQAYTPKAFMSADKVNLQISYQVPTDIANPADSVAAAMFAWQEFIALTWPAKRNPNPSSSGYFRCVPDSMAQYGSEKPGSPVVWETYYHRDELYPNYLDSSMHSLPDPNAVPNYLYGTTRIAKANPNTKQNLFNNLDEATEISIANMYFTPLARKAEALAKTNPTPAALAHATVKAGIMYEAKGNSVIYNYVNKNSFNNNSKRAPALQAAINRINNKFSDTAGNFNLPNGSIEIKATWRRYNSGVDNLKKFHWSVGMYYTNNANNQLVVHNDTILLVGLHIIQKTPNVPTFVFATFEHVSNERNGFRFKNAFPQTAQLLTSSGETKPYKYRPLPDAGLITAKRQFPIPSYIARINMQVQLQLRRLFRSGMVWTNYQLIGVQALVTNDPTAMVPKQQFFLSNFATETNNTLQFFQGGLTGGNANVPDPSLAHVFKYDNTSKSYKAYTAGGCLGCHGSQGQFAGGDFSVIAATGNSFVPQAVTPYDTGNTPVPQNPVGFPLPKGLVVKGKTDYVIKNFKDVQGLLEAFVSNHAIPIAESPHKAFWDTTYNYFVTGQVPNIGLPILTKGDSANSTIIKILNGPLPGGYPRMPYQSGTLPINNKGFPRQDSLIKVLSIWIQDSCPNPPSR
jgi:hypothetical protein